MNYYNSNELTSDAPHNKYSNFIILYLSFPDSNKTFVSKSPFFASTILNNPPGLNLPRTKPVYLQNQTPKPFKSFFEPTKLAKYRSLFNQLNK